MLPYPALHSIIARSLEPVLEWDSQSMDIQNSRETSFGKDNQGLGEENASAPGAVSGKIVYLTPDANNVVVLPPDVSLEDVQVVGRDLVVVAEDGTRYVIQGGAVDVPQLVIDGVEVPPLNLAALLIGNEPEPAAGATQSSGGNFADPAGPIQDAFDRGDLLPYTELAFPEPEEEEVDQAVDNEPDIVIVTPDNPAGAIDATATVNESGLPERGDEPEGTLEPTSGESTVGNIVYNSLDGTDAVLVNGVEVVSVGQQIAGEHGILTITSIADGVIGYSYTLTDNTSGQDTTDVFTVTVIDTDGDTATADLTISIVDDAPIAQDDVDAVGGLNGDVATGNVMTGASTITGAAGADTEGADGASVSSVTGFAGSDSTFNEEGNLEVTGEFGTLVIDAAGNYTYTPFEDAPGAEQDVFTYILTDGDGSTAEATLTINLTDQFPVVGPNAVVQLDDDALAAGNPGGTGDDADSVNVSGTLSGSGGDGALTFALTGTSPLPAGFTVSSNNGTTLIISQGATQVLQVVINPANGSYTVTQLAPLDHAAGGDENNLDFTVTYSVTDVDDDSANGTLNINVDDDTPVISQPEQPFVPEVVLDESPVGEDEGGDFAPAGLHSVTISFAGAFGSVSYGADGPGSSVYGLTLSAEGASSGLYALGAGGAQGEEILLYTVGNDIVGMIGSDVYFTISADAASGEVTFSQSINIYHGSTESDDDTSYLVAEPGTILLNLTATDADGDSQTASVDLSDDVFQIEDDGPNAADDTDSLSEGGPISTDGNVITGVGTDSGAGGADTEGADGAQVGNPGSYDGTYGTLVLAADGSYTYTLNALGQSVIETLGEGETLSDSFDYTLVDGDNDSDGAVLTITLNGTDDGVTITGLDGQAPEVVLDEDDLANVGDDQGSDQTDPLSVNGNFGVTSPDGLDDVQVNGVNVVTNGVFGGAVEVANDGIYSVSITGWTPVYAADGVTVISATFSYSASLLDNTLGHTLPGQDTILDALAVTATDQDGSNDSANLDVQIVDDVPTAQDDADSLSEGGPISTDGNVITGVGTDSGAGGADTEGADGAQVGNPGSYDGTYGTLVLAADGSYTYTLNALGQSVIETLGEGETLSDSFDYTLVDGDNDSDGAVLTITLNGTDDGVTITGLDGQAPEVVLDEDDLANVGDDQGSDQTDPLSVNGNFGVTSPDGLDDVQVNGVNVVTNGVFGGAVEVANDGIYSVSITGWTPVYAADGVTVISATFSYSASLLDNTLGHTLPGQDTILDALAVTATDQDGSNDSANLDVQIVDDVPTAEDDADSLSEGGPISTDGNVITGVGTDSGAGGADTEGADGAQVGNPGSYDGTYGTLVLAADGSYTYTLNALGQSVIETLGEGETLSDSFDYTLVDGDNDSDGAVLTITLNGTDDGVTITGLDGQAPEVVLDEDDLANVGDDQGSDQTDPLSVNGNFGVTSPDGLDDVQVNGVNVVTNGVFGGAVEVANDGIYSVSITGWTPVYAADGVTVISATFSYSASLLDNTLGHTLPGQDTILDALAVTATDQDGSNDSANLDVQIVDDVPTAEDDADSLSEGGPISTDGNVITGVGTDSGAGGADTEGADGAQVGNPGSYDGTYGTLVLAADGSYTYTLNALGQSVIETLGEGETLSDSFDYTLVDGDNDSDGAVLTITLNGTDDGVTITGLDGQAPEVVLDEDDLANVGDDQGSDQTDPLSVNGNFGVTSPDGLDDVQVNGVNVVTNGVFGGAVEVANDGIYSVSITGWTPVYAADGVTVISATFSLQREPAGQHAGPHAAWPGHDPRRAGGNRHRPGRLERQRQSRRADRRRRARCNR